MTPDDLLPHVPPARMLTAIRACDREELIATARIDAAHPLATDHGMPIETAVEIAAQAAACHGVLAGLNGDRGRASGYLVGVQELEPLQPMLATAIDYEIRVQWISGSGALGKWRFTLRQDGTELARGSLSTMRGG